MSDSQKVGFVFPGQGSQSVGMLKELASDFSIVVETFAQASDLLHLNLWQLVQQGPKERLNQTQNTQPAMLAADVAVWRAWKERSGKDPVVMAGHSLGEYAALVCAGALDFSDAVVLVAERGRLMQEAVPEGSGAMAAVLGLEDDKVDALCAEAAQSQVVEAVNFNSPGQVVVAGHRDAVQRLIALAKPAGAKRALLLPVSVPSHCALMQTAAESLAQRLQDVEFQVPGIQVIHNVSAVAADSTDSIRDFLARQLFSPVRWVATIREMVNQGVNRVIEMGPGKVLMGLTRRIDPNLQGVAVFNPDSLKSALETVNNAE